MKKIIICFLLIITLILLFLINQNKYFYVNFYRKIDEIFKKVGIVNLNIIESSLKKISGDKSIYNDPKNTVNVGFTLGNNYVLETMMTITSIMDTQKKSTKIRFHIGVVDNFTVDNMIKIYKLKEKINNSTEFNFYLAKESMEKMKNFHINGVGCPAKIEMIELVPKDVKKLLIFDGGDVIILRDLLEMYNYDLGEFWAIGTLEPAMNMDIMKQNNIIKYINFGGVLLNIQELKKVNFWKLFIKNKNKYNFGGNPPDQNLFNILVPNDKKGYFPFKFGGSCPFTNDYNSDHLISNIIPDWFFLSYKYNKFIPNRPKSKMEYISQVYNPIYVHQFESKWKYGDGISLFRNYAKYFFRLAGIYDETCKKYPGYCKK